MKKQALALFLSVVMVFALFPAVFAADAPTSGKCGDNLTWRLADDTLYIEGIGDMYNFLAGEKGDVGIAPWKELDTKSIAHIQVAPGVTSIGDYAFDNLTNLLDASLPEGITRIGDSAFDFCYNATNILLPTTITSIGKSAFHLCMVLVNLKIPAGVTEIGQYAFGFCEKLTSITIPEGISSVNDGTFSGCSGLAEVIFPQSLKSIGFAAFENCRNIVSINIPDNVTNIDHSAFWGCQRLKCVSIPIGVTELSYTFTDCRSLSDVYYGGNEAQWEQVKRLSSDSYLENATIHFNSKMPEPVPKPSPAFTDVKPGIWYADAVKYVSEHGLMGGTGGGNFSPDDTTTRGTIMTILARRDGVDTSGGSSWYEKGMEWAKEKGVSDGTDPDGIITREQLATMLYRDADSPEVDTSVLGSWPDGDSVSDWAVEGMAWAVENGIINGADGKLLPSGTATRAQTATMLQRYCTTLDD